MSIRPTRRPLAALAAAGVAAAGLSLVPAVPAHAAETGSITGATATWGLSTYLNSSNFGRPNPYPTAYVAPAAFDPATASTTWGEGTGTIEADGSAELSFAGTSVNFAKTSGAWIKLTDIEASLDSAGNGTVTAEVSYGASTVGTPPNMTYDDSAPARPAARVDVVDLTGNTAADRSIAGGTTTWAGLDGTWSPEFLDFIDGDADADPAVAPFIYAGQVNDTADRTPLPFTFSAQVARPAVQVRSSASSASGVTFDLRGDGFRGVTNPGDNGIYVGIAPAGGRPSTGSQADMDKFAAVAWIAKQATPGATGYLQDGAFTVVLTAPKAKLDPRLKYAVYTWQAHGHSNTSQDTQTPVAIDWKKLGYPLASTTTAKVAKAPTTKKAGKATIRVASSRYVPGGKVKVVYRGGKLKGKKVKVAKTISLSAQGTATLKLPKSAKGKRTLKVTYLGSSLHKASTKTVKVKVKR